jgi:hypothetical protein
MAVVFSKTFRTLTDLFKDQLNLLQLFYRDTLEGTFAECCVSAKEWDEHLPTFFSQGLCPYPTIFTALHPADKVLLAWTIHRHAD